uniref:(northern house mosquito) hypothetical protein n=1 Tax=Culex pipiens TaxID=7175 RepID=A0A8D8G8P5_CULPI
MKILRLKRGHFWEMDFLSSTQDRCQKVALPTQCQTALTTRGWVRVQTRNIQQLLKYSEAVVTISSVDHRTNQGYLLTKIFKPLPKNWNNCPKFRSVWLAR